METHREDSHHHPHPPDVPARCHRRLMRWQSHPGFPVTPNRNREGAICDFLRLSEHLLPLAEENEQQKILIKVFIYLH